MPGWGAKKGVFGAGEGKKSMLPSFLMCLGFVKTCLCSLITTIPFLCYIYARALKNWHFFKVEHSHYKQTCSTLLMVPLSGYFSRLFAEQNPYEGEKGHVGDLEDDSLLRQIMWLVTGDRWPTT